MKNILTAILLCVILALNGAGADGKDKVAVRPLRERLFAGCPAR